MFRTAVAVGLALLSGAAVEAQSYRSAPGRGKVHRMEIVTAGTQTVRYFGSGLTPDEASTLRDLERLENESAYARNLNALKQQYVSSERILEPYRRITQMQLAGLELAQTNTTAWLPYGYQGYPGYYGYANYVPVHGRFGFAPAAYVGGYGVALGTTGITGAGYGLASALDSDNPVKESLAKVMSQQATPEYAASLERAYDRVALRASASPALRLAMGIPPAEETRRMRSDMRAVEFEKPAARFVLTLKSGEVLYGKSKKEDKDWVTLDLAGKEGGKVRIRMSEVMRIDENPSAGRSGS